LQPSCVFENVIFSPSDFPTPLCRSGAYPNMRVNYISLPFAELLACKSDSSISLCRLISVQFKFPSPDVQIWTCPNLYKLGFPPYYTELMCM